MTPAAIGVHGGRTPAQVRAGLDAALRERGRLAVRGRAISAWQARALLAHQRADLTAYVFRRYPATAIGVRLPPTRVSGTMNAGRRSVTPPRVPSVVQ